LESRLDTILQPVSANPPEVSVVIPTRNRRQLLRFALASVLEQRGVRLEVIVVDEASTDGTAAMVRSMADPRLRLVRNDVPLGKSAARNRGIAETTGDWVAFLDDDDVWAPDKLRLQLEAARATARAWSYTGAVNISVDHHVLGGAPPEPPDTVAAALHRVNSVPGGCSSVIVSKKALPQQAFDGRYRLCEDWDLWIRLARVGPPAWVPQPLVGYRVHAGNSSEDTDRFLAELEMIEQQYGGPVDRRVFYRHLARVSLRMNRQWQALRFCVRAAAHDRKNYMVRGFLPDAREVLAAVRDRLLRRFGVVGRSRPNTLDGDPYWRWKAEARAWLEPFTQRHTV
jgi:glycosyltransferase involved in cell wall biosynthesis